MKRIVLQSNVEMHLYVGTASGSRPPGATPQPGTTANVAHAGRATPNAPEPEKAHVTIKSPGRFQYDLFKDYDLAHFDVATAAESVLTTNNTPHYIDVTPAISASTSLTSWSANTST